MQSKKYFFLSVLLLSKAFMSYAMEGDALHEMDIIMGRMRSKPACQLCLVDATPVRKKSRLGLFWASREMLSTFAHDPESVRELNAAHFKRVSEIASVEENWVNRDPQEENEVFTFLQSLMKITTSTYSSFAEEKKEPTKFEKLWEIVENDQYVDLLEVLLKNGLNPNLNHYKNMLEIAVKHNNDQAFKLLLKFGADPCLCDDILQELFCTNKPKEEVSKFVDMMHLYGLKLPVKVEFGPNLGKTASQLAQENGYEELAEIFTPTLVASCLRAIIRNKDLYNRESFSTLPTELQEKLPINEL